MIRRTWLMIQAGHSTVGGAHMLVTNFDYNTLFRARDYASTSDGTQPCLAIGSSIQDLSTSAKDSSTLERLTAKDVPPITRKKSRLLTRMRSIRHRSRKPRTYAKEDDFDKLIEDIYYTYQLLESDGDTFRPREGGLFGSFGGFSPADLFTGFRSGETKRSSPVSEVETVLEPECKIPVMPTPSSYTNHSSHFHPVKDISSGSLGSSAPDEYRQPQIKDSIKDLWSDEEERERDRDREAPGALRRVLSKIGRKGSDISYKWGHQTPTPGVILAPINKNVANAESFQSRYESGFIKTRKTYNENEDEMSIDYDTCISHKPNPSVGSNHMFGFLRPTRREEVPH